MVVYFENHTEHAHTVCWF